MMMEDPMSQYLMPINELGNGDNAFDELITMNDAMIATRYEFNNRLQEMNGFLPSYIIVQYNHAVQNDYNVLATQIVFNNFLKGMTRIQLPDFIKQYNEEILKLANYFEFVKNMFPQAYEKFLQTDGNISSAIDIV
jgi:hypothetical protein